MSYIDLEEFKDTIVVSKSKCDDSISLYLFNEDAETEFSTYLSKDEVKDLIKMLEDTL